MSHWDEFGYVIINDDVDTAVDELEAILAGGGESNRTSDPAIARRVKNIVV